MQPNDPFSQEALDWFDTGERLETLPDMAPYEPFERVRGACLATIAASLLAVGSALWLLV